MINKFQIYNNIINLKLGEKILINYPNDFIKKMEKILGEDFKKYLGSLSEKPYKGLRVNTLKCSKDKFFKLINKNLDQTPFSDNGFYYTDEDNISGKSPLHHSGAIYIQEPSAMSAVTLLNPKSNDKVLDLCASPGGKSTQIATYLTDDGLIWANEIVKSRANILLSNIERMGIKNAVVSNCHPEKLCNELSGFFDKILVDAPCSGEGMFRKDENAISEWSSEHSEMCGKRQLLLLETAKKALAPGGEIVYSTCTFSEEENENVILEFLKDNTDFVLCEDKMPFGRCYQKGMNRIFPMDGGEGHFCVKLKNISTPEQRQKNYKNTLIDKKIQYAYDFYKEIFPTLPFGENLKVINDKIYAIPDPTINFNSLNILRYGVLLGEIKKDRIEPHHAAFLASKPSDCCNNIDFSINSNEIINFLKGNEIPIDTNIKGWTCVSVDGITVGFGKCSNGVLKNKYPKGLRNI